MLSISDKSAINNHLCLFFALIFYLFALNIHFFVFFGNCCALLITFIIVCSLIAHLFCNFSELVVNYLCQLFPQKHAKCDVTCDANYFANSKEYFQAKFWAKFTSFFVAFRARVAQLCTFWVAINMVFFTTLCS